MHKNYERILKRKLAYLLQTSDTSIINSPAVPKSYLRFDEQKEQEIVVWIRQLQGEDKQQIMDNIIDKFNISEEDAERLFFVAYPDGLSFQEEENINQFEPELPQCNQSQFIDDSISIIIDNQNPSDLVEDYEMDPEIARLFIQYLMYMLGDRNIIQLP